ncbi:hypothetical protein [Actinokineospora enzanensis]|uniref:sunset domain-containing protein n=1 Tax=Actinokineospora enzanensis TaxID=155975 RepID=UPI00037B3580|nr:hypothetical protein [Actinokineospora enzanensis]
MPFFGQVWVWSLAGFLVGAALCWLLIGNPARKRVTELEGELAEAKGRANRAELESRDYGSGASSLVPGFGDTRDNLTPARVEERRVGGGGEDSIRRGLLTLSDEDEGGLRALPAPAFGADDHDHEHEHRDRDLAHDGHGYDRDHQQDDRLDRDDHDGHDERDEYDDDLAGGREHGYDGAPEPRQAPEAAAERTQYIPPAVDSAQATQFARPADYAAADTGAETDRDWFGDPVAGQQDRRLVDDLDGEDTARGHDYQHGDRQDYAEQTADEHGEHSGYADEDERPAHGDLTAERGGYANDYADDQDGEYGTDEDADADQDADYDDDTGTIFTQHTTPISGDLIRDLDADGRARGVDHALVDDLDDESDLDDLAAVDGQPRSRHAYDDSPGGDLADEHADEDHPGPATEVDYQPVGGQATGLYRPPPAHDLDEPEPAEATQLVPVVRDEQPAQDHQHREELPRREEQRREPAHAAVERTEMVPPVRAPEPEPVRAGVADQPGFQQPIEPTLAYGQTQPERMSNVLPKRIPSKPQNRFPFGVQTSSPANPAPTLPAPTPAAEQRPVAQSATKTSDRERSLFEPILAAEQTAAGAKPAPAAQPQRLRGARTLQQAPSGGVDPFVPPGPFGPGSAMPLPGGRSPSSEYTIKASVTALRYCAPDSPKFDRTVAEVWFRSVADAERVGFRPLG